MIDADALDKTLVEAQAECKKNGGNFRFGVLSNVRENIANAPTIPAIPVEWLGKIQERCVCDVMQMPMYVAIGWLVDMWRQEQEAR